MERRWRALHAAVVCCAFAPPPILVAADDAAADAAAFRAYDANHDGFVTKREMRRLHDFDRAFDLADSNRDGKLDVEEFARARAIYRRMGTAEYVDDSVITAKVKAALRKERIAQAVGVETHKGVVLLSGVVADAQQRARAVQAAAAVDGVVKVKDGLALE